MSDTQHTPYRDRPLSAQRLRELVREARGGFAPDYVGAALRHRYPRMVESDAAELTKLLRPLIESARDRLREAGITPHYDEHAQPLKLSKREREYVTNIAALVTFHCDTLTHSHALTDALGVGIEAVAWCRTIDDQCQLSIAWRAISSIYRAMHRYDEQEDACRRALAAARASGGADEILGAIDFLGAFLVAHLRYDEAEQIIINEGIPLAQSSEDTLHYYPTLLFDLGRIRINRSEYVDGIRVLREALYSEIDCDPAYRAGIASFLGTVYLRLGDYQQSIACQHKSISLAEEGKSDVIRGWGYFRLAEVRFRLKEIEAAEEVLDRADECTSDVVPSLKVAIGIKRVQIYADTDRFDEAVRLYGSIHEEVEASSPNVRIFAYRTMGGIAMRQGRYDEAERLLRLAVEISSSNNSLMTAGLMVQLAQLLHAIGRESEVNELLDAATKLKGISPEETISALRLRASVVEKQGDIAKVIQHEREAFEIERKLLERRAEESLRNEWIIAETTRLERESEIERERRRRLEHELAEAIVELGDRERVSGTLEERLRKALNDADGASADSTTKVLKETLHELGSQGRKHESPLRYLGGVDEEFYGRLRQRCPGLTSKQERLCGLLRAGLASKEVASLLGLEPEGLKAQRKRLRKRLGLAPDERLESILAEL